MDKTAQYNTILFSEVFPYVDDFMEAYTHIGFPNNIKYESLQTLFLLLYGRYGNNPIANRDVNQWTTKLFSIVFQYGPAWEKKLTIQEKLRGLSEAELTRSSKAIHNHAYNPDTAPGTASLEELAYINDQSTSTLIRSKLDAYDHLIGLLENDVTDEFLAKFKTLFKIFVKPERVLLYGDADDIEELDY